MSPISQTDPPVHEYDLHQRLVAGDGSALVVIYDVHSSTVYSVARRVCGNTAAAEEVTQDVFVHLWQQPQRFDPERGKLRTYLAMIAHRRSVDWVRSHVAREQRQNDHGATPTYEASTEDQAIANLDGELAWRWLDLLPGDQRACLELAYVRGLTFRQVAAHLGIPEGTAKGRIRLGLKRLHKLATESGQTRTASVAGLGGSNEAR